MTDSHLMPVISARKETNQDVENTPPGTSSYITHWKKRNKSKQDFGEPKMSTPKCKCCMPFSEI